ncbi:MAG: pyrroline-5-carboxylate reductase [Desulfovibrionaceae bacterium]|nr:pyrroline-5-carboxylate reductase [Desulfovibrionaceae bacterium]
MFKTIGIIGCGNMGGALLKGMLQNNTQHYQFCAYNRTPERLEPFKALGVECCANALEVATQSDLVLLGVKPQQVTPVLESIRGALSAQKVLISIAAGISLQVLQTDCLNSCHVVRCMPDTPALVGKGIFAFAFASGMEEATRAEILTLFGQLGLCLELTEDKFAAFSALIGAGPAYVFTIMHAMIQAGITLGFRQEEARMLVQELLEGCAVMGKESSKHLMRLRDNVLSPQGLTIAGVNVLDRAGFSGILIDAVMAAYARAQAMEKSTH